MSDWDTVTVLKKRAPKASTMKSEQAINAARRQGVAVDTQQKCMLWLHSFTEMNSHNVLLTVLNDQTPKLKCSDFQQSLTVTTVSVSSWTTRAEVHTLSIKEFIDGLQCRQTTWTHYLVILSLLLTLSLLMNEEK